MVTTALETGIGGRAIAHMAALASRGPTPCAAGLAPGWGALEISPARSRSRSGRPPAHEWLGATGQCAGRTSGRDAMACCHQWPEGSGVVIGSGGSSGGRKWCLQSWENLEQSASSCANWLQGIGVDPSSVRLVNPLPSHHMGADAPDQGAPVASAASGHCS